MTALSLPTISTEAIEAAVYPEADTLAMAVQAGKLAIAVPAVLTTDAEALEVQGLLADCKALADLIDSRREAVKAPFLELGRRIDAVAKAPMTHLDAAIGVLRSRLTTYAAAQAKARADAEAAAAAAHAADTGGYTTPPITTEVVDAATPAVKVATRTTKTVRIVDDSLIPLRYRPVDTVAVRRALMAGIAVPGAELVIEKKAT